jgi:hypothetical protein
MMKPTLSKKKAGSSGFGQKPPATAGFGAGGATAGAGFGFGSSPQAAATGNKAFGFQAGAGGGTAGFQAAAPAAGGAPFGGVGAAASTAKVGFGFGAPQQQFQGSGSGVLGAQQQQQQHQYVLTEEQKRQNKLDRILEKQSKLETLLPTPGAVDRIHPPSTQQQLSLQQQPPQQLQTQTQHYQTRGQSLLRGSLAASDPSRGRPLSSGIVGTSASGGRNNPLMSPEVLLGRRAKKLTIDHSQYEDMTEGMPSPFSKIVGHKKQLARGVDQALVLNGGARDSSSTASAASIKKAKQEEQAAAPSSSSSLSSSSSSSSRGLTRSLPPPVQPHFDPPGALSSQRRYADHDEDEEQEEEEQEEEQEEEEEDGYYESGGRAAPLQPAPRRSQCPVLTKEGYFTRPDLRILQAMSPPELASVPNFTVYVPNIGSITWQQRTDVRGLDLDLLVTIEHKAVTVYPEGTFKPAEGTGLNKTAEVTLYNIFPKRNASQSKQLNFVNKLRMSNDSSDATFESYDLDTGTWVFSTTHFSKHGLSDSDSDSDDDDEADENMSLALQLNTAAPKLPKSLSAHKKLPPAPAPVGMKSKGEGDWAVSTPPPALGGGFIRRNKDLQSLQRIKGNMAAQAVHEDAQERQRELKGQSDAYAHLIEASTNYQPRYEQASEPPRREPSAGVDSFRVGPLGQQRGPHPHQPLRKERFKPTAQPTKQGSGDSATKPDASFVEAGKQSCRKLFAVEDSPCMRLLKAAKDRHTDPAQHQTPVCASTSMRSVVGGRPQRPVDAALYMGRSFRVGWSSDGKLLHTGNVNFNKLVPAASPSSAVSIYTEGTSADRESCHGVVRLQTIDTMLHHGSDSFDVIPRLMASFKNSSLSSVPAVQAQQARNRTLVPLWRLPKADVNQWDEYVRFVNLLKQLLDDVECVGAAYDRNHPCWIISRIVSLMDAICGQEVQWIHKFKSSGVSDFMMPLMELREEDETDKDVSLWERRRELISRWLKSICEDDIGTCVSMCVCVCVSMCVSLCVYVCVRVSVHVKCEVECYLILLN